MTLKNLFTIKKPTNTPKIPKTPAKLLGAGIGSRSQLKTIPKIKPTKKDKNAFTMLKTIYIEADLLNHPRVKALRNRYPTSDYIVCEHYGEVFNKKSQNFRLQKQAPALILAKKEGQRVLPAPENFGISVAENYYFSHFLNCPYDCRYCFLQGMYWSANYVWFINYEDFQEDILKISQSANSNPIYFFSGYDGDSLALEPLTNFVAAYLPFFATLNNVYLELRTKSVQIRSLLKHPVIEQCIIAFSFTPEPISKKIEHGVPSVQARIHAMQHLAKQGWKLGLRLDPLIDSHAFEDHYQQLIDDIFSQVPASHFHSVSIGPMRFPKEMYHRITALYPTEPLFAQPLSDREGLHSYPPEREAEMAAFVSKKLLEYIDPAFLFKCYTRST